MKKITEIKAMDVLLALNRALAGLRLYPSSSAIVSSSVDSLYQRLLLIFEEGSTEAVFAESEKSLLFNGEKLSQKDQERPQIAAFLETMFNFNLKSIVFDAGIDRQELMIFLEALTMKPEDCRVMGGMDACLAERGVKCITVDKKVYVVKDGDHQLLAALEMTDEDVIRYLTGADPRVPIDKARLREMARDPQWLAGIFQSGLALVMQDRGVRTDAELAERLVKEIGLLEGIVAQADRGRMVRAAAQSVAALDAEMVGQVLTQGVDAYFDGQLFLDILDELDEEKFAQVVDKIRDLEISGSLGENGDTLYRRLLATDKGQALTTMRMQDDVVNEEEALAALTRLKGLVEKVLAGLALTERGDTLTGLLTAMDELSALEKSAQADGEMQRLCEGLLNENELLRDQVAEALSGLVRRLPGKRQIEVMAGLSHGLLRWIERESLATLAYSNLCHSLKDLVQWWFQLGDYDPCLPVLEVFHAIYHGLWEKNDTAHDIASDIVRTLASRENLDRLFDAFDREEDGARKEALGRMLTRLGEAPMDRFLDRLRDAEVSDERVRILQILTEVGRPAVPPIRARIDRNEPWYFLRNLAYLLGRIESAAAAEALAPFLLHHNDKVRQEALKSIHRLGARDGGPVLLAILNQVDETFQASVVEELGSLKYGPAVAPLIALLKDRSLIVSSQRAELEEKICLALGRMNAVEAVPILKEIGNAGFFSMKKYSDKVKTAATKALIGLKLPKG